MSETNDRLLGMQKYTGRTFNESPSAFMRWLNPIIRSAEFGALIFEYTVREDMTNPMQVLHGGVTAGIIDDIIGATVFTMGLSAPYTTINNNIDYFAPAKTGDVIEARTSVIKRGTQIINLQCEIWLVEKKRLLARGYSNMIRLEVRATDNK
ncbi:MAG: PaaI family thioesterase [Bacteroidota bacterium]